MDLSRRYVCFFVFLGVFLLKKVLLCELSSGIRTKCGDNVSFKEDCPKTCCFDTSTTPNCYFQEKDYGPIQHSNGLCVNMKDGSDTLIWSTDCTSKNAFFLVSYHYPPYHVATGKCVLPSRDVGNPGNADLVLKTGKECKKNLGTYRPTANGNLKYFYGTSEYFICIGSKSAIITEPHENENVSIQASVCAKDNSCKLSYVYERKIYETRRADFQCESCSTNTIEIIWANYGVEVRDQYPFAISTSWIDCVTTEATGVMQEKCSGKTSCSFIVKEGDFLPSNCRRTTILLVRYTCSNVNTKIPAAPNILYIKVRSQNELLVVWSNDNKNGSMTKFQICWNKVGKTDEKCRDDDVVYSEPRKNRSIYGLEPATKYIITVARYNSDGKTLGRKRQEVTITRSAPLQASGIKSATSFQMELGALKSDDKYIQIIVSKLQSDTKPTEHPGNDLLPYDENTVDNQPYIAAQLDGTKINQNSVFTVGDGKKYAPSGTRKRRSTNYQNVQLEPETYYSVFQRTFQSADLYYDSDWMDVIKTDKLSPSTTSSTFLTNVPMVTTVETITKQSGGGKGPSNDDPDDGSSGGGSSGGSSTAIIGAAAGGAVLLIILVIFIIIFIRRRRRENNSSDTHLYDKPVKYKTSKNKETVNEDQIHQNNPPSSEERDENPNVITAPSGDVHAKPIKKKSTPDSEQVEDEESTYTALKRPGPGEEENDGHLYTHLIEVHKDYVNQNPDKIQDDANYEDVENEESTYTALKRTGPGEEESDVHLYAHLIEVNDDYVNQKETGF